MWTPVVEARGVLEVFLDFRGLEFKVWGFEV